MRRPLLTALVCWLCDLPTRTGSNIWSSHGYSFAPIELMACLDLRADEGLTVSHPLPERLKISILVPCIDLLGRRRRAIEFGCWLSLRLVVVGWLLLQFQGKK